MAKLNLPVSILQSEEAGRVPSPDQLKVRQLWINTADATLGTKTSTGNVVVYHQLTKEQYDKATTPIVVDGVTASSSVSHYVQCDTVATSVSKQVELTNYVQGIGALVIVRFDEGNEAKDPTLSVSGNPSLPIMHLGKPLGNIPKQTTLLLVCSGTQFEVIGLPSGGIDYSKYYTKEEALAKFASVKEPQFAGSVTVFSSDEEAGQALTAAYYAALESNESSAVDSFTKEEMDAMFAKIVNAQLVNAPVNMYDESVPTGQELAKKYEQALAEDSGMPIFTRDQCRALFVDMLTPKTVGNANITTYTKAKMRAKLLRVK